MSTSPRDVLQDGDVTLRPQVPGDKSEGISLVVEHAGRVAGTVQVHEIGNGNGELSWAVLPGHRGQGVATRAVRLLVRFAFDQLGLHRVVAYIDTDDRASLRVAGRAGLRREGIVRGSRQGITIESLAIEGIATDRINHESFDHEGFDHEGFDRTGSDRPDQDRRDRIQLARLATDPEPTSGVGFIGVLNAGLPTKRVIAQGLIRNNASEILLCELTYKREWDLPGGVVDPAESPAHAVVREIREEMQVDVSPLSLVAVNWLPPWHGWDDATLFVFDLGVDDDAIAKAQLEPRELLALHWCSLDEVEERAAPYVTRMLRRLEHQSDGTAYLEDGTDPGW